jgi:hypothetical protein
MGNQAFGIRKVFSIAAHNALASKDKSEHESGFHSGNSLSNCTNMNIVAINTTGNILKFA